jgi:hypothetical protein
MIRIVVELNEQGQVGISAPLDNKILCLGLLEAAKAAVLQHQPGQQGNGGPKIVVPQIRIDRG